MKTMEALVSGQHGYGNKAESHHQTDQDIPVGKCARIIARTRTPQHERR